MSLVVRQLEGSLRQTVSAPVLEGAAGVVAGIVVGDLAANYVSSKAKQSGNLDILVRGVTKFVVAGLALFVTTAQAGAVRVIGTSIALGSVGSFFVDVLAKYVPQLGIKALRSRQVRVYNPTTENETTIQTASIKLSRMDSPVTIELP